MQHRTFAILLALAACAALPAQAGNATVSDAWFRALPGKLPAGGYFVLKNSGSKPLTLIGAQSPACGTLMLHMTHQMGGMSHMMAVDSVEVPAHGTFAFAPGGYHLMCMEPALKQGTTVPVTLKFAGGETLQASFQVRSAAGK
jgi:periplasmic copper chaperone A